MIKFDNLTTWQPDNLTLLSIDMKTKVDQHDNYQYDNYDYHDNYHDDYHNDNQDYRDYYHKASTLNLLHLWKHCFPCSVFIEDKIVLEVMVPVSIICKPFMAFITLEQFLLYLWYLYYLEFALYFLSTKISNHIVHSRTHLIVFPAIITLTLSMRQIFRDRVLQSHFIY